MSPYHALGVTTAATDQDIRNAYTRLLRQHPPEQQPEHFHIIQQAYSQIRHADDRLHHATIGTSSDGQPASLERAIIDHCRYSAQQTFPDPDTFCHTLRQQLLS